MFTQSCHINKNTKELSDKLKNLGREYVSNGFAEWYIPIEECTYLYCSDESFNGSEIYYYTGKMIKPNYSIDCGTNEELFLAIAALRDDTDKDQVFIHQDGNFYKCECDSKIDMWGDSEESESYPRKATVSELIELFKK